MIKIITIVAATLIPALLIFQAGQSTQPSQEDKTWNRRVVGAGSYQTVVELSGRVEVARQLNRTNALDLQAICTDRLEAEKRARRSAESYLEALEKSDAVSRRQMDIARLRIELGQLAAYRSEMDEAIGHFSAARESLIRVIRDYPQYTGDLLYIDEILGIAHLRKGELDNCVHHHNPETCIFPIRPAGRHTNKAGSSEALKYLERHFRRNPENLEVRWLLNLANMTLGAYPGGLDPKALIPGLTKPGADRLPAMPDVAGRLGLDVISAAGGSIVEDFDNDGLLDIVISSVDACESIRYFRNNGDGSFTDRTTEAGLKSQLGGINCVQTDFDNDGYADIFVMRGGWEFPMRNSLLRNNRDGTFTDVTEASGLLSGDHRTHSAAWADFDRDGLLDVFIGHEQSPSKLFRNLGEGRFEDITDKAGIRVNAFTKGVAWGDYDNDSLPDLYVSNYGELNQFYRNNGDGTFTEMAAKLGIDRPVMSFPTWFFDYDNDGWQDLFVASFVPSVTEVAAGFLGLPASAETMRLYRNNGKGGFDDVTKTVGLDRVVPTMGANFGDLDNDGFLEIYLGTGAPSYAALMPNFLFHNLVGKRFADVTSSTGTGHLQKGHGVSFADLDNDGDLDLYANIGGFIPGDRYNKALFANPGSGNNWISIKLIGNKSNRAAIGAKIKATVIDAAGKKSERYSMVSTGGSFGANSLAQHIGLGKNGKIDSIEVAWPSGKIQKLSGLNTNQFFEIRESEDKFRPVKVKSFSIISKK